MYCLVEYIFSILLFVFMNIINIDMVLMVLNYVEFYVIIDNFYQEINFNNVEMFHDDYNFIIYLFNFFYYYFIYF